MTDDEKIKLITEAGWSKCDCLDPECPYWIPPDINDYKSAHWCLAYLLDDAVFEAVTAN